MKRIVIPHPGAHDVMRIEDAPDLVPGPGQVVVRVQAAGVNYADCVTRMGLYASAKKYEGYPMTPGFEVAGHVEAAGDGVGDLAVGEAVLAVTRFRGYAEQVLVPRSQVYRRPAGMTFRQAATFPAVFLTAWYALFELAHPHPGDLLLVHSAAGGVGSALLQLARAADCRVVGVVGAPHKVQAARDLGAERVIDKSSGPLWAEAEQAAPEGYAAIFDANGPATLRQSYRHLAPTGKLVVYGFHSMLPRRGGVPSRLRLALDYLRTPRFDPFRMTGENRSVMGFNLSYLFDRQEFLQTAMNDLLAKFERGLLRLPAVTPYPFEEAARAHCDLESGQTVGKLVLCLGPADAAED